MRYLLFLITILTALNISAQDFVISGTITDASTKEELIGAVVETKDGKIGAVSDYNGFYTISIDDLDQSLKVSYIGYKEQSIDLSVYRTNSTIDVKLIRENALIDEVIISADNDKNIKNVQMSVNKLDINEIQKLPAFLGEKDLIKSIQLLPGVTSVGEGASGFNVRGGSIDQNLVLLDDAPIYNSAHLFGFFSVFNPDAVKDVELYKGGIPSRYGGRLSSILDVSLSNATDKDLEVNGGVGTIFSRLSIQAPIVKNKSSLIVAGRRSYIDVLAKPFLSGDFSDSALNFYDLTLKSSNKLSSKDDLYISGYLGRDNFAFGARAGFNWGNQTLSLKWRHLFSDTWSSNITAYQSKYDYQINFGEESEDTFDWNASILNYSVKADFINLINSYNTLRFGFQSIYYTFEPANAISVNNDRTIDFSVDRQFGLESSAYLENEISLIENLTINYGLRLSHFAYLGGRKKYVFNNNIKPGIGRDLLTEEHIDKGEIIQDYINFEPRLGINFELDNTKSLKVSYNRTSQYIHLLSNTTASTPVDLWTPSTNNIKPQKSDQYAIGYFQNLEDNTYELSAEVYYKDMFQLVDYIDGATLVLNEYVEGQLLEGNGRAYGIELLAKKNKGALTGWLSYTLSRTERKVNGVNNNDWFPSRFDKTHNFSLSAIYDINDRWSLSSTFAFSTGTPTTLPSARYSQDGYFVPYNEGNLRNNYRIPSYHRLDIAATLNPKKSTKKWKGTWVFGIYNLYSRRNPFSIYGDIQAERPEHGSPISTSMQQLSVIGNFIPSISYNFKFK